LILNIFIAYSICQWLKNKLKTFALVEVRQSLNFDNLDKVSISINFSVEKQQEIIKEWEENKEEINKHKLSIKYLQEKLQKILDNIW